MLCESSGVGRIASSSDLFVGLNCYTTFMWFPVENGGWSLNLRRLAIREMGRLEEKGKKSALFVGMVTIVAEVYRGVCQQHTKYFELGLGRCEIGLCESSAVGRIASWSDLFVGLYRSTTFAYFLVKNCCS